ncbi:alpha-glucosidase [Sphingomonas nostoxanthinifaciens]|uniref:alpha-glucosidase n=1 Tax=Sphingomonas nostoxanthinifaciens TaxID=2872652 RepID=UPI001CC1E642|nr:alpha-glucosidase [Sphingomonas nostoxanthinifaciens]UAK23149.1 alpha-glucosidase [Sphingomonas nostoxanthinifaciens]
MLAWKRRLSITAAMACAVTAQGQGAAPARPASQAAAPWWSGAFLYEIYPRSFGDSNGDGVGDLPGITQHLDDLKWLGVDAIWLTPSYPSPQIDFGYDISDYEAIDPQYGMMADFAALQSAASSRGIRVLMDMVLNHTSDQHAWFKESATSRTNPKADWYVWNDGLAATAPGLLSVQKANVHDGRVPPNNWTSLFGGSAWTWVPARRQFYYHKFYVQQPDLNWRNPAVERAMFDVMRFWLDRGVAGFRLDAIPTLFEDPGLRNEPESGGIDPFGAPNLRHIYTENLDEVHGVIKRMRAMVDGYPGNRVLVGETYLPDTAALDKWYGGAAQDELHLPMDMLVGFGAGAAYRADYFRPLLRAAQTDLHGAMPLLVFDNHDQVRSIDRFADGVHDRAIAKGIAAILLLSRATALTYYGAPIGMRTATPTRREDVRDPIGISGWPREKGRDGERTPMQWTAGAQAGFSTSTQTWLPVSPDHVTINVATERADPASLLNWHHTLIALRRSEPALSRGTMQLVGTDPDILAWKRRDPQTGATVLVAINMSGTSRTIDPADYDPAKRPGQAVHTLAQTGGASVSAKAVVLSPYDIWVGKVM